MIRIETYTILFTNVYTQEIHKSFVHTNAVIYLNLSDRIDQQYLTIILLQMEPLCQKTYNNR